MRRNLTLFLLVVALAAAAPAAGARRAARPKSQAQRTFHVVAAQEGECALSSRAGPFDPGHGCGTWTDAATAPVLGAETVWFPALDGLPLSLDVTRPIHGTVVVNSRYLVGYVVPSGAGVAQLKVTVAGVSGGEDVIVGSVTTEPYAVAPNRMEYEVDFRIDPDAALSGARLTDLRLGLEVTGPNAHHNLYYADGRSTVTLPLSR